MSDSSVVSPERASRHRLAQLRQITLVIYVLYGLAPLTAGLSAVVALLINLAKRRDAQGTLFESHLAWQAQMFWWGLMCLVLGYLTVWWHYLGLAIFLVGLAWFAYRLIKGFSCLNHGQAVPLHSPLTS